VHPTSYLEQACALSRVDIVRLARVLVEADGDGEVLVRVRVWVRGGEVLPGRDLGRCLCTGRRNKAGAQEKREGARGDALRQGEGWVGGACRAVPQQVPIEDFDAVAVVQPLVLPDSHL